MKKKLHVCVDKSLPPERRMEAARRAVAENPHNLPHWPSHGMMGVSPSPFRMALLTGKKWKPGRVLRCRFLDQPSAHVRAQVERHARTWCDFANIEFRFVDQGDAEIRIGLNGLDGSWSYLGTDALSIDASEPTMNFGWFDDGTPETEFERTTCHEFGHALACTHEHNHPDAGIPWDKPKVYAWYAETQGWSKEDVDQQVFMRYERDQTQFSTYDRSSIMHYPVEEELTIGTFSVGWNLHLSDMDKAFIASAYPKQQVATRLIVGAEPLDASIERKGEVDDYDLRIETKARYRIQTLGGMDVALRLLAPSNGSFRLVAANDDSGLGANARIQRTLAPGEYRVQVRRPRGPMGSYRIEALQMA